MRRTWLALAGTALAATVALAPAAAAAGGGAGSAGDGVVTGTVVNASGGPQAAATASQPAVTRAQALATIRRLFPRLGTSARPTARPGTNFASGDPVWRFTWPQPSPSGGPFFPYMAVVDARTGELLGASLPPSGKPRPNPVPLQQAQATASAFLEQAAPMRLAHLKPEPPASPFGGGFGPASLAYVFRWARVANDIPLDQAAARVTVDALTGRVTGYNLSWRPNLTFPDPAAAMAPGEAVPAALRRIGLVLVYAPLVSNPPAGAGLTLQPFWEIAAASGLWDAASGGSLPHAAPIPAGTGRGPAPARLTASPPAPVAGAPIGKAQAEATAAAAVRAAGYTGLVQQSAGVSVSGGPAGTQTDWLVDFAPPGRSPGGSALSVNVSQATGRVVTLSAPPFGALTAAVAASAPSSGSAASAASAAPAPSTPSVTSPASARAAAEAFLKIVAPQALSAAVAQVASPGPYRRTWHVQFSGLYDGIPVPSQTMSVAVDPSGRVVSFFRNWPTLTPSGPAVPLVGEQAAARAFAARPATLVYRLAYAPTASGQPPQPTAQLAYTLSDARAVYGGLRLDAVTGATLYAADGLPADAPPGPPARVRGSWAAPELWALAAQHLLPAAASPNATVDRGQALLALVQELGLASLLAQQPQFQVGTTSGAATAVSPYERAVQAARAGGVLAPGGSPQPGAPLTRQALVTWIVRALGYGSLIGMPNRVQVTFSDARDLAPATANAVGLAQGLGIVTGMPDGAFRPAADVTWAQLAAMLFRAARLRAEVR